MTEKREDHMDVASREQLLATCCNPTVGGSGLTLWAMAITAVDRGALCATSALIEMPAERGRTTPRNGQQHFDMLPTDPRRAARS